ncbi:MAG: hypothetical protein NVSMB52_14650 [Chloroflexota bacterium]
MTDITIRAATRNDTPFMRRLTETVWDGHDYIPSVWPSWLADSEGMLMVALLDGCRVGLQHVAIQHDGSAWVEGIRVSPDVRGQGVGRALLDYAVAWARDVRCPAIRLATNRTNPASNCLATSAGMTVVEEMFLARAEGSEGGSGSQVRVGTTSDFEAVHSLIRSSDTRLYTEGWTAHVLSAERLRLLLAVQAVRVIRTPDIEGVAVVTGNAARPGTRLGLLCGSRDARTHLARAIRQEVVNGGMRSTLAGSDTRDALKEAGYAVDPDDAMIVHGLQLRSV